MVAWTAGTGSLTTGVFSVAGALTVALNLAKGDLAFSFLVNHGWELLRLSFLTAGVSILVSLLVTGAAVVLVGTAAGDSTEVARGSVDSTWGMTGAVSLTSSIDSASLAGTVGDSASGFFSLVES